MGFSICGRGELNDGQFGISKALIRDSQAYWNLGMVKFDGNRSCFWHFDVSWEVARGKMHGLEGTDE